MIHEYSSGSRRKRWMNIDDEARFSQGWQLTCNKVSASKSLLSHVWFPASQRPTPRWRPRNDEAEMWPGRDFEKRMKKAPGGSWPSKCDQKSLWSKVPTNRHLSAKKYWTFPVTWKVFFVCMIVERAFRSQTVAHYFAIVPHFAHFDTRKQTQWRRKPIVPKLTKSVLTECISLSIISNKFLST